jgi:hypothetical protein
LDECIVLCEDLVENRTVPEDTSILIDLRKVVRLFQFDEIYQLVAWHKSHGFPFKGRFAFLVDRPATIGTANIFCSLLQLQSVEAEMFDDDSLAMAWLANAPRISGAYARRAKADEPSLAMAIGQNAAVRR